MSTNYLQDMAVWLTVGNRQELETDLRTGGKSELSWVAREHRALLVGRYSGSGLSFTIRQQYSGTVVGRARGHGYDRQGSALADALRVIYGLPRFDGAAGESTVKEWARQHGVAVYDLSNALYSVPAVDSVAAV